MAPALRPQVIDGAVTLEQAAAIEEFAGEPTAYERLVTVAANHPPGLHYALSDERHKRQVAYEKAVTRRQLVDAGVRIITKPKDFPWSSVEVRLRDLTGADGGLMTVEEHASCPGHAAFVDVDGQPVYVCRQPKDWGHETPPNYRHRSREEVQADVEAADARREQEQVLAVADGAGVVAGRVPVAEGPAAGPARCGPLWRSSPGTTSGTRRCGRRPGGYCPKRVWCSDPAASVGRHRLTTPRRCSSRGHLIHRRRGPQATGGMIFPHVFGHELMPSARQRSAGARLSCQSRNPKPAGQEYGTPLRIKRLQVRVQQVRVLPSAPVLAGQGLRSASTAPCCRSSATKQSRAHSDADIRSREVW